MPVESLNQPAYLTGPRFDVLAFHAAAGGPFNFSRVAPDERNTLILVLTNPAARGHSGKGWKQIARHLVAQFRATHDLWVGGPAFVALIACLQKGYPEFSGWWNAHEIRAATACQKALTPRKMGAWRYGYASFRANDDPALRLMVYTPVLGHGD